MRPAAPDRGKRSAFRAHRNANAGEHLGQLGAHTLKKTPGRHRPRAGIERGAPGEEMQEDDDPLGRVRRFAGLRARTFAMVQRRGLDVWDWRVEGDGTVYQLLRWLAEHDASLLTRLRAATAAPGGA